MSEKEQENGNISQSTISEHVKSAFEGFIFEGLRSGGSHISPFKPQRFTFPIEDTQT